jgi:hypothetical protein
VEDPGGEAFGPEAGGGAVRGIDQDVEGPVAGQHVEHPVLVASGVAQVGVVGPAQQLDHPLVPAAGVEGGLLVGGVTDVDAERPAPVAVAGRLEPHAEVVVGVGERRPAHRQAGDGDHLVVGDQAERVGRAEGHGPVGDLDVLGLQLHGVDAVGRHLVAHPAGDDVRSGRLRGLPETLAKTHGETLPLVGSRDVAARTPSATAGPTRSRRAGTQRSRRQVQIR